MRLKRVARSRNIEDRRGTGARRGGGVGRIGLVGFLAILALGYFTGLDVTPLLTGQDSAPAERSQQLSEADQQAAEFASRVLTTTETVWSDVFQTQLNESYTPPRLVIFSGVTQSPCGGASGATGPFYCPADEMAYLDLAFFTTLSNRFGARGDFAAAYVIAHEVAHHVQNQTGIMGQVAQARNAASRVDANELTKRLELQADCLSGIWARNVSGLMDRGDLQEALNAARMIGDDHLQRQAGRVPQPHTFTHGSSEQRARWFQTGYDSGQMRDCDTFNVRDL